MTDRPVAVLALTVARLSKRAEVTLAAVDLSLPQYRALAYLSRRSEVASRLAGQLAVSRPTVTALVDGLVGRGLVERSVDRDDRRRVRHELTPAGRTVLRTADVALLAMLERIAGHLAPEDARAARDGLALWYRALDADLGSDR